MIDFHCHLDLYPNSLDILPKVAERNIFTLVVTTSPKAWLVTSKMFAGYNNIQVAVGMHPEIVEKKVDERDLLMSLIPQSRFIGEVGIDGSERYKKSISLQEDIFNDVLVRCESEGSKVLSIHSKNAAGNVLNYIEQHKHNCKYILHWFSGSIKEAVKAVSLGCWFSIGPAMLRGLKGRKILEVLPINKIVPETDGPFTQQNYSPLMPWEAIDIIDMVACLKGEKKDTILFQLKDNLRNLIE